MFGWVERRAQDDEARALRIATQAELRGLRAATLGSRFNDCDWWDLGQHAGINLDLERASDRRLCGRAVDLLEATEEAERVVHR